MPREAGAGSLWGQDPKGWVSRLSQSLHIPTGCFPLRGHPRVRGPGPPCLTLGRKPEGLRRRRGAPSGPALPQSSTAASSSV